MINALEGCFSANIAYIGVKEQYMYIGGYNDRSEHEKRGAGCF